MVIKKSMAMAMIISIAISMKKEKK